MPNTAKPHLLAACPLRILTNASTSFPSAALHKQLVAAFVKTRSEGGLVPNTAKPHLLAACPRCAFSRMHPRAFPSAALHKQLVAAFVKTRSEGLLVPNTAKPHLLAACPATHSHECIHELSLPQRCISNSWLRLSKRGQRGCSCPTLPSHISWPLAPLRILTNAFTSFPFRSAA